MALVVSCTCGLDSHLHRKYPPMRRHSNSERHPGQPPTGHAHKVKGIFSVWQGSTTGFMCSPRERPPSVPVQGFETCLGTVTLRGLHDSLTSELRPPKPTHAGLAGPDVAWLHESALVDSLVISTGRIAQGLSTRKEMHAISPDFFHFRLASRESFVRMARN